MFGAIYRNRDNDNLFQNISTSHNNINQNNEKKDLTPIKNNRNVNSTMYLNPTTTKKKNDDKSKDKNKMKYNYLSSTYSALVKQHSKKDSSINNKNNNSINNNNNNNNNNKNINKHKISNIVNNSSIITKKEFDNLEKILVELFSINNSITKENNNNKSITSQNITNIFFKNLKPQRIIDILVKNQNIDDFTGFVFLKKNFGIIEKEIKIENNIEEIKQIFISILLEITNEEYEFIIKDDLLKLKLEINNNINNINKLNNEKNENILKDQKIKKLEDTIQKREEEYFDNQREFLKLKNELEKIQIENNKLKEKINLMEKENKKIIEDYGKLK